MAALPYMPLYVADYMADAAHLSTLEHGAYLLLIMTYWQRGEPLPADDRKLSRIARMTEAEWAEVRDMMAEFFTEADGEWHHKRIDQELAIAVSTTRPSQAEWTSLRRSILKRDGEVCAYCGGESGPFEIDHVVPISRGGGNAPENLAVACRPCNRSKRNLTLSEWGRC